MKKAFKLKAGLAALIAAVFAFALWAGWMIPPVSASAETNYNYGAYDYTIVNYTFEAELSRSRALSVKETITAEFSGYDSHGIIRDFPLGGGMRYKNLKATCDHSDFSPY